LPIVSMDIDWVIILYYLAASVQHPRPTRRSQYAGGKGFYLSTILDMIIVHTLTWFFC
jgi:hypothetical protein